MPKKETYYACPYCLTKIDDTKPCNNDSATDDAIVIIEIEQPEETSPAKPNSMMPHSVTDESIEPLTHAIDKIKTLEKQKAELLSELDELRKGAMQKICDLNEEVAALREEAKILKELTD